VFNVQTHYHFLYLKILQQDLTKISLHFFSVLSSMTLNEKESPMMEMQTKKVSSVEDMSSYPTDIATATVDGHQVPADFSEHDDMKQSLKSRHLQMMALAGAIGTGLFLGSGRAVAQAGPLGALMGYTFVGAMAACVVLVVAEMGALVPLSGGIVRYAEIFVDPALSFANGWNLVYKGLIFIPTEIVAAAVLMQFWTNLNSAVVSLSFLRQILPHGHNSNQGFDVVDYSVWFSDGPQQLSICPCSWRA
jgi:amino acid permease